MERVPTFVLLVADAVAGLHAWMLSHELPAVVLSHFDAAGRPDGRLPRALFIDFYLGAVALLSVVLLLVIALITRGSGWGLNLPNKAHWLAPERREATFGWIRGWSALMGTATVLFLVAVMQAAARANLGASHELGVGFFVAMAGYVVFSGVMLLAMMRRFTSLG